MINSCHNTSFQSKIYIYPLTVAFNKLNILMRELIYKSIRLYMNLQYMQLMQIYKANLRICLLASFGSNTLVLDFL